MKNVKKSLLIITTGLTFAVAVTVFASNQQSILTSIAGGITVDGNKRTLVLDSSTPLNIDEYSKGTLTIGNIGVYAPNCSALENGVARLENGSLILYCQTAGLYEKNSSNYHYGFGRAPIESITITYSSAASKKMYFYWAQVEEDFDTSTSTTSSNITMTGDGESHTITIDNTYSFILSQNSAREINYPCIYISTALLTPFNLISLTVQYSCN